MTTHVPVLFTLFGATGDLAQKKIVPALFALYKDKKLPEHSRIIAFSRRPWSDAEYREFIRPSLDKKNNSDDSTTDFLKNIVYVQGTFDTPESYSNLYNKISEIEKELGTATEKIFHLSVQPEFFVTIFTGFKNANLTGKILVEKPFGHDLESAKKLQATVLKYFSEDSIYRIDHYLGKSGLNRIFETRKNDKNLEAKLTNKDIKSITVRLLENIDIAGRGEFYETIGALRDVGQNHLLEMLAVFAMSIPDSDEKIPGARAQVLNALQQRDKELIKGTYVMSKAQYHGYTQEPDVKADSTTETYFKIHTGINISRWIGIPITLEAGKALAKKVADIQVLFNDGSEKVFDMDSRNEGDTRDAYEILIEKAMMGDKTSFVSIDEVMASWKFITPILEEFKNIPLTTYPKGWDSK